MIKKLILDEKLEDLPELEKRRLVAQSLSVTAGLIEEQQSEGLHLLMEFENHDAALALANLPRNFREKSLNILLNPKGEDLKQQLEKLYK